LTGPFEAPVAKMQPVGQGSGSDRDVRVGRFQELRAA
jgi:hypothetical protein